jgi:hypothetical protein
MSRTLLSTRAKERKCPNCDRTVDADTFITGQRPEDKSPRAGDWTVCLECGRWLVFTAALNFRYPTPRELDTMDEGFARMLAAATCLAQEARAGALRRQRKRRRGFWR